MDNKLKQNLINYFNSGCKPLSCPQKLGLEVEHFIVDNQTNETIGYYGDINVRQILSELGIFYDEKMYSESQLIGLKKASDEISLEPAGQIEISISPQTEVSEIKRIYTKFREEIQPILDKYHVHIVTQGYQPKTKPEDLPLIPKERYRAMDHYFEEKGPFGRYMMRGTASTQISIDYYSEEDFIQKYAVAYYLSPFISLYFENTPGQSIEGLNPHLLRMQIWSHVDKKRVSINSFLNKTGVIDFAGYADFIEQIPEISYATDEQEPYCEETLTRIISLAFPAVRLKKIIEIRIVDSLELNQIIHYCSIVKSIFNNIEPVYTYVIKLLKVCPNLFQQSLKEISEKGMGAMLQTTDGIRKISVRKVLFDILKMAGVGFDYFNALITKQDLVQHKKNGLAAIERFERSSASYRGEKLDTCYLPKIFGERQTEVLKDAAETMSVIMNKAILEYIHNPEYRKLFGFSKQLVEMIINVPKYQCLLPVARVDIFFDEETGDFMLCELNTDGTSAMNEDKQLCEVTKETLLFDELRGIGIELSAFELFDSLAKNFLNNYHTLENAKEHPHVVVTDFSELGCSNAEFEMFAEAFRSLGCTAEVCEIRKLSFHDGALYSTTDQKIDLIYRRAVTADIMEHLDEIPDFLHAVKEKKVFMMGDFCTQVVHDKRFFCILQKEDTLQFLTPKEREFVKRHIPQTHYLDASFMEQFKPQNDKNSWILKPMDSYGSHGIYAGRNMNDEEWNECLSKSTKNKAEYIAQKFIEPYRTINFDFQDNNPEGYYSNLTGLYVYCLNFAGIYSRQAKGNIISSIYDEFALGTFLAK